jgi:hypothetical protein
MEQGQMTTKAMTPPLNKHTTRKLGRYNKEVKWGCENNSNWGNKGHSEWGHKNDNQGDGKHRKGGLMGYCPSGPYSSFVVFFY